MTESKLYELLESHGIAVAKWQTYKLDEMPKIDFYPVALKIESPKVVHKSEYGAVKLSIISDGKFVEARDEIIKNVTAKGVKLDDSDKIIATQMIKGEELYFGMINDPVFGKTILFGKGGVLLELYKDVCFIDVDADEKEVAKALSLTKISKLFNNFRGFGFEIDTAVQFVTKLQNFIKANPSISEMDLNPVMLTKNGLIAVDARVKFDENASKAGAIDARTRNNFFDNSRVAIIGASSDTSKVGYAVAKNSLSFKGDLFFVNSKGGELFGKKLYTSIGEIDGDIDTAVLTIPSKFILTSIEELAKKGVKNLVVISAGFKEVGDLDGEKKLQDLVAKHNINLIGPNCLGYYEGTKSLNLTFGTDQVIAGDLALISQSGAVLSALMDKAYQAGIGFSHIVSVGNMADLNFADLVSMCENDTSCKAIAIYAEGLQHGKAFMQVLRKCKKPIFVFKTGKSNESKKAAFSHTGNLSGNYEMFRGLLESTGCKIEENIESLIYHPKFVNVKTCAIITNAGGPASILTDYIIDHGKKLYTLTDQEIKALDQVLPFNWPKSNPIDIIGDAMSDRYQKTLEVVEGFAGLDLIYLVVTPQFMTDNLEIAKLALKKWKKPVIPVFLGGEMMDEAKKLLKDNQVLVFDSLSEATAFL